MRALEPSAPLRRVYQHALSQFSARQLVFLDETQSVSNDARWRYGYDSRRLPAFMKVYNTLHGVVVDSAQAI